jgi:hypothetical protein
MSDGMLVEPVRFDESTRRALTQALRRAKPDPAAAGHKAGVECAATIAARERIEAVQREAAIRQAIVTPDDEWPTVAAPVPACRLCRVIRALEGAAEVVAVLRGDGRDPDSIRETVGRCARLAQLLRTELASVDRMADDLTRDALILRGVEPSFFQKLGDDLNTLEEVLRAAEPPKRPAHRPKGAGRVEGVAPGITNWLGAEVARILRAHDIKPTQHRDGVFADVVRALWPAIFGVEAPSEMQFLLRSAVGRARY